jgi:5'-3' exonuclease
MADNSGELVLIDLSSIAYPIYLTTQADPDPNKASQQIVARVRDLVNGHPHAAICCDSGRSFRHDLTADSERAFQYKGNRPEREAPLHHQIALAVEALAADGFPVWSVKGFEADDLIAAATARALTLPDLTVLIVSSDKDLLQLVGERVRAKSAKTGDILDTAVVEAKFGIPPSQLRDYLTLVGDTADNIKGAKGIGEKTAAQLLSTFGSLDAIYEAIAKKEAGLKPAVLSSLIEFQPRMPLTRTLVTLRTDIDFPFEEIVADRVPKEAAEFAPMDVDADEPEPEVTVSAAPSAPAVPAPTASTAVAPAEAAGTSLAVVTGEIVPVDYERQLDPRSMKDARILAKDMYESRMFSAYGTPQAVLSTVMVGRELGLPAMASLRGVHVIEGKHALSASLMVALVLKSGMAEYFEPVSFDDKQATFATHRRGARNPVQLTHTMEMARQAWPKGKTDWEKAFIASGWGRVPTDMLVARATSRLARMVYPDLLAGLYTPEELAEIREQAAA